MYKYEIGQFVDSLKYHSAEIHFDISDENTVMKHKIKPFN